MTSRTRAAAAIAQGRVAVDGRVVRDPDHRVDLARQQLWLDGAPIARSAPVHLMLHKPCGIVTTASDERGRATVMQLLPPGLPHVAPVGRLDQDSSGLLLFTNDTVLAAAIAGDGGLPKVYEVECDVALREEHAARMSSGMTLPDGTVLLPVVVEFPVAGDRRCARLTLREGRNRQIRRMVEACGRTVVRLHRVAIGPLQLGDLALGAVRSLTDAEVAALRAALQPER